MTPEQSADYVTRVLASAPPLTDAQRERITELLRNVPSNAGVTA
jgi:hypothetical protein